MARYYVLAIKLLEPLRVTYRLTRRGPAALTTRIPGSTLGGALARKLGFTAKNVANGGFLVSDAYPVLTPDGDAHTAPTVPSFYSPRLGCFKIKLRQVASALASRVGVNQDFNVVCVDLGSAQGDALSRLSSAIGGLNFLLAAKKVSGKPIALVARGDINGVKVSLWRTVTPKSTLRESVTISSWEGRAFDGMLFAYTGVKSGEVFWATLYVEDDSSRLGELAEGLEVKLGSARSRGYGLVRVVGEDVTDKLDANAKARRLVLQAPSIPVASGSGSWLFDYSGRFSYNRLSVVMRMPAPGSVVELGTPVSAVKARWGGGIVVAGLPLVPGFSEPLCDAEPVPLLYDVYRSAIQRLLQKL